MYTVHITYLSNKHKTKSCGLVRAQGTEFDLASKLICLHYECHESLEDTDSSLYERLYSQAPVAAGYLNF